MTHEPPHEQHPSKRSGIHLLPNALTTGALFFGFYAIVAAMKADYEMAAIGVYLAMILDALDGRVARMTNTQSAFGAQYDSLSDSLSFGLAPALIVYHWSLQGLGKPGWLVAFFYTAAAALRLARFNSTPAQQSGTTFWGLPTPAAAGWLAGLVWISGDQQLLLHEGRGWIAGVTLLLGTLMVSNVPYPSFKNVALKEHVPFVSLLALVVFMMLVSLDPPQTLFGIFSLYVLSGPLAWVKSVLFRTKSKR